MQSLARKRRADRAQALRNVGVDADIPRVFAVQTKGILSDTEALRLPVDLLSASPDLGSPGSGRLFIIGMDPLGGPNPL